MSGRYVHRLVRDFLFVWPYRLDVVGATAAMARVGSVIRCLKGAGAVISVERMEQGHMNARARDGANLEQSGMDSRLRLGVVMTGIALLSTIWVVQSDVHRMWRLLLFLPFFMATLGAWQGLYRICPAMAMKGVREGVGGCEERIGRPQEREASRRIARLVLAGSVGTALFSTIVVLFLP